MEKDIDYLKWASFIVQILAGLTLAGGVILAIASVIAEISFMSLVLGAAPISVAGMPTILYIIISIVIRFLVVAIAFFWLYTISIALRMLARIGEDVRGVRIIQYHEVNPQGNKPIARPYDN